MRTLLIVMQIGAGIAGGILILSGLWSLARMASRRNFLVKATGTIRSVEKKLAMSSISHNSRDHSYSFIPTISFQKESGETVEFKSEVGHLGNVSKYRIGESIAVLYDPEGEVPPMIDDRFARWGGHLLMIVGGIMFLGGAALVQWVLQQPQFAAN